VTTSSSSVRSSTRGRRRPAAPANGLELATTNPPPDALLVAAEQLSHLLRGDRPAADGFLKLNIAQQPSISGAGQVALPRLQVALLHSMRYRPFLLRGAHPDGSYDRREQAEQGRHTRPDQNLRDANRALGAAARAGTGGTHTTSISASTTSSTARP